MTAFTTAGEFSEARTTQKSDALKQSKARVMLVDDSLTVRTVLARMIGREPDLEIIAQAGTAEQALRTLRTQAVDVILLDLEMPGMGGLDALPKLLEAASGAQVLVVSSLTKDGAEATLAALSMGAADTMLKPRPGGFDDAYRSSLLCKVRALAGNEPAAASKVEPQSSRPALKRPVVKPKVVAIGASTGGIHALTQFLKALPQDFALPILITQHLPSSFIPVFARQMELASGREALLAGDMVEVKPQRLVIAPGHGHMIVRRDGSKVVTALEYQPAKSGCMPSVDPMFSSCAEVYEGRVAGVLLSGMGRDGTDGARMIAKCGGAIFAQDEESSAVWGMPRTVAECGIASAVLPPAELAGRLAELAGGAR